MPHRGPSQSDRTSTSGERIEGRPTQEMIERMVTDELSHTRVAGRLLATGIFDIVDRWVKDEIGRGSNSVDISLALIETAGAIAAVAIPVKNPVHDALINTVGRKTGAMVGRTVSKVIRARQLAESEQ